LRIIELVSNPGVGGLESVVESLGRGLVSLGHDLKVLLFCDPVAPRPPLAAGLESAGVNVEIVFRPSRSYLRERRMAAELCESYKPDVVHTHGYRADLLAEPVIRSMGIPTVGTVHGFAGGDFKNRIYEWLQLRAFRRFSAVIAVSRPLAEHMRSAGIPAEKLHLVLNGWRPASPPLSRLEARAAWIYLLTERGSDLSDGFPPRKA